MKSSESWVGS